MTEKEKRDLKAGVAFAITAMDAMKVAKRIAITILCCVPVLVVFGYLTRKVITSDVVQIICFMAIMAVAVVCVEVIARAKESKQKEEVETKRDVFK